MSECRVAVRLTHHSSGGRLLQPVASEQREGAQGRPLMRGRRKGGDAEVTRNEFGGTQVSSDCGA